MGNDEYQKFMVEVTKIHQRMTDHYAQEEKFKKEITSKLNPIYDIFESVKGFNNISVWIIKLLIGVGAAVGVLYGFLKWIKQ